MKLYFASGFVYLKDINIERKLFDWGVRNRLYSYSLLSRVAYKNTIETVLDQGIYSVMVDSGAFSLANSGFFVDIKKYAEWLFLVRDKLECYINLDVVPNSTKSFSVCAEEGWDNLMYLESVGLKPLPVYRVGEPIKFLDKILDKYEYFCLSKTAGDLGVNKILGLDGAWQRILDYGFPVKKVHGLAMTSKLLMTRYPWYSVDSSTWSKTGIYGQILVDRKDKNSGSVFSLSKHSPKRRQSNHYDNLSKEEQLEIEKLALGIDFKSMLDSDSVSLYLDLLNVKYFLSLEKRCNEAGNKARLQQVFLEE